MAQRITQPIIWWLGALAALTLLRLLAAWIIPLSPDEAYYWVWSRALAPGYLDHPPMVALAIRAGTSLAGHAAFGVRLLAPLAAALGTLLLAGAAADLLGGSAAQRRQAALVAAILLNATPALGIGAIIITPDTPLLLFWAATIWALARWRRGGNAAWWLVAGMCIGAALASKYTGLLLGGGVALWLFALPETRHMLRTPWPWLAAGLALAIFAPVLWWNAAHHWASFLRQGSRTADFHPARAVQFLGELVGGQIALASPIIFALFVLGSAQAARAAWRRAPGADDMPRASAMLLVMLIVPPALVFVQHALGDRVQGNWPVVIYPAAAIAAARLSRRWVQSGAALGLAMMLAVLVQAATGLVPLSGTTDPILRLLGDWPGFARSIAAAQAAQDARFIATDSYSIAAELARTLPPGHVVVAVGPRWGLLRLPDAIPDIAGQTGLLVRSARRADTPDMQDWASLTELPPLVRGHGGLVGEAYRLYRVQGRRGADPAVRLPDADGRIAAH